MWASGDCDEAARRAKRAIFISGRESGQTSARRAGRAMSRSNDAKLDELFGEAERRGVCLTTSDKSLCAALRRRAKAGTVVRPRRGMYARPSHWNSLARPLQAISVLCTLQELHPDWVFCHESAALAFGLPVSYVGMDDVHVAVDRKNRGTSKSSATKFHVIDDLQPVKVRGLWVTPLDRTTLDCLRTLEFGRALAIADCALRRTGTGRLPFIRCFREVGKTCRKADRAVHIMRHADARSESGGESIARAAMIELGYEVPRLQVTLPRPLEAERSFRVDFLWSGEDGKGVIGELDGMQKYDDEAMRAGRSSVRVLADEQHRESQLTLYGMPIVRLSFADVMRRERLISLLDAYGIPRNEALGEFERRLLDIGSPVACEFGALDFSSVAPKGLPAA